MLENAPVDFLLGNEFLISYNAIINYKERTIILDQSILPLNNAKKTIDEILEERLLDNIYILAKEETINFLKYYRLNNDKFNHIKNLKVKFKVTETPLNIKGKNYSVPFNFLHRAKDEVIRLLKEGIISLVNLK